MDLEGDFKSSTPVLVMYRNPLDVLAAGGLLLAGSGRTVNGVYGGFN